MSTFLACIFEALGGAAFVAAPFALAFVAAPLAWRLWLDLVTYRARYRRYALLRRRYRR